MFGKVLMVVLDKGSSILDYSEHFEDEDEEEIAEGIVQRYYSYA